MNDDNPGEKGGPGWGIGFWGRGWVVGEGRNAILLYLQYGE